MKKSDTWMPLYIGDYLADTSRLTTEQHGAYLLLLMDYWRNGPAPDEETVLASIAKLTLQRWRLHAAALARFFVIDGGRWIQKRAEAERIKAGGISVKRSTAGKEGAESRWMNGKPAGKRIANAIAEPSQTALQTDAPSPSQSSLREEPPSGVKGGKRSSKRCPAEFAPTPKDIAKLAAECPGVDLERETEKLRDWEFKDPRSDWNAAWRTWIRTAFDRLGSAPSRPPYVDRKADAAAAQVSQWTGGILGAKPALAIVEEVPRAPVAISR